MERSMTRLAASLLTTTEADDAGGCWALYTNGFLALL
jgi:hypothetical protein